MTHPDDVEQPKLFDAPIIPLRLAIKAMRDSGYKNTAYALAELIDNAAQADASMIEVLCIERRELVETRERVRLRTIAVLDNGSGMDASTLRMALQFGNGTRLNDRTGIGRFGMGLPNASISQAGRIDVWSWQNGSANALSTFIDLDDITAGKMIDVPIPVHSKVPEQWSRLSDHVGTHGTLIVWSNLDFERLSWKRAARALDHTERIVGRIYRRFIRSGAVTIRLFARQDDADVVVDREAQVNDPLYLGAMSSLPAPFDGKAMFDEGWTEEHDIEFRGASHRVTARYSIASQDTVTAAGTADRGQTEYGKHAALNAGVSVLRAGREIMLDDGWCIGYDPRERWWGAEIEFPPALDEAFGVTNNKQAATHFSELAGTDWRELAEDGETFIDVVARFQDDGDPRGSLLRLNDAITRNLERLRKQIKAQGAGKRSSRRTRHGIPDDVTKAVNRGWKERSKQSPIHGEDKSPTETDLDEIRSDLTENKRYGKDDADDLVSLIRDADLRVVFLEADFSNPFELFNVEIKGNITEITFNRQHPGFDDMFGTVATVGGDVDGLSPEEVIERLTRAINGAKVLFAGWARYEREAGVDRAKALQRVRFDWGQMSARFLRTEDEL